VYSSNAITRSAPIKFSNGSIGVQTIDNKVFCLDGKTGEILWAHFGIADDLSILSGFSLDEQNAKIAFQYSTGEIFVVHLASGEDLWTDTLSSPLDSAYTEGSLMRVASAPLIVNDMVISYGGDGYAAAFDLNTGKNIWKKEFSVSRPFWVSGNTMFAISKTDTLFAADIKTGNVMWKADLTTFKGDEGARTHWTPPVMIDSNIITISSKGTGVLINAVTGKVSETLNFPEDVYLKPVVVDSGLYLTSNDGYIYRF
jgi:outer membrane protein assembly factor BamB